LLFSLNGTFAKVGGYNSAAKNQFFAFSVKFTDGYFLCGKKMATNEKKTD